MSRAGVWFAALLFTLPVTPAGAAAALAAIAPRAGTPPDSALVLTAPPRESTESGERLYAPLAAFLSQATGRPVVDISLATIYDAYGYHCHKLQSFDWVEGTEVLQYYWPDDAPQVNLPFQFGFYGDLYRRAWPSANGYLNFMGWDSNSGNVPIPDGWWPNLAIYPFWDDLYLEYWGNDRVKTTTLGAAPDRVWVLEYENLHNSNDWSQGNFEVKLYERTGEIEFLYQSNPGYFDGRSATLGIENEHGGGHLSEARIPGA